MNNPSSTVTVWEGGRLALATPPQRLEFGRDRWIAAALLLLSAIVLALFVAVLVQDVQRGALRHEERHTRALTAAQCESQATVDARDDCRAQLAGAGAALASRDTAPADAVSAREGAARATTVSLSSPTAWRQ